MSYLVKHDFTLGYYFLYDAKMKNGDSFEKAVVTLLEERVDARGMSQSDFARLIFKGDSVRLWRLCRAKKGRRRRLSMGEAYSAAEALGEDFATLMWGFVQESRKRKWID